MAVLDHYVQGSFTSTGALKVINVPTGVDFIEVTNLTIATTPASGTGFKFEWQRGMSAGAAIQYTATTTTGAMQIAPITSGGFTLTPTSGSPIPGAQLSGTAVSTATPPIVSSANTGSLANGNLVQIYNVAGAPQFNGYVFSVDTVVANTSFRLPFAPTLAVAGTTLNYRILSGAPAYYPQNLLVTAITSSGVNSLVTFATAFTGTPVGQELVFNVSAPFGMIQMNGLRGTILAFNATTNVATVNIDSSGFSAFTFPTAAVAAAPFTPAQAIPWGDGIDVTNPWMTSDTLAGATYNTTIRGIALGGGANGPAGQTGNVIYWRAWKAEQIQTV